MNLYEKINAIMGEIKSLQKDGRISYGNTKYNYLSEAKTTETFREQLIKNKLVLLPIKVSDTLNGQITIGHYVYRLINCENPEEYIDLETTGQGHDSADKGSGKASSYGYKYLIWRSFALPSNDDPDQVSSDEITEIEALRKKKIDNNKVEAIRKLIVETESDESMLLTFYNIKSLEEMTVEIFTKAVEQLEKKRKKK